MSEDKLNPKTIPDAEIVDDTKDEPTMGYSDRINDPYFEEYRSEASRWHLILTSILAALATVFVPLYSHASSNTPWPAALLYGLSAGITVMLIGTITNALRRRDHTWDGVVVDRSAREITRFDPHSESTKSSRIFEIKVRRDEDGRIFTTTDENDPTLYAYFRPGDRVRHHAGFSHYEKYDKSSPGVLLCIVCGSVSDRGFDRCSHCGAPLLK